jgi:hypothetical protein
MDEGAGTEATSSVPVSTKPYFQGWLLKHGGARGATKCRFFRFSHGSLRWYKYPSGGLLGWLPASSVLSFDVSLSIPASVRSEERLCPQCSAHSADGFLSRPAFAPPLEAVCLPNRAVTAWRISGHDPLEDHWRFEEGTWPDGFGWVRTRTAGDPAGTRPAHNRWRHELFAQRHCILLSLDSTPPARRSADACKLGSGLPSRVMVLAAASPLDAMGVAAALLQMGVAFHGNTGSGHGLGALPLPLTRTVLPSTGAAPGDVAVRFMLPFGCGHVDIPLWYRLTRDSRVCTVSSSVCGSVQAVLHLLEGLLHEEPGDRAEDSVPSEGKFLATVCSGSILVDEGHRRALLSKLVRGRWQRSLLVFVTGSGCLRVGDNASPDDSLPLWRAVRAALDPVSSGEVPVPPAGCVTWREWEESKHLVDSDADSEEEAGSELEASSFGLARSTPARKSVCLLEQDRERERHDLFEQDLRSSKRLTRSSSEEGEAVRVAPMPDGAAKLLGIEGGALLHRPSGRASYVEVYVPKTVSTAGGTKSRAPLKEGEFGARVVAVAVLASDDDSPRLEVAVTGHAWRPDGLGGNRPYLSLHCQWGGLSWDCEREPWSLLEVGESIDKSSVLAPFFAAFLPRHAVKARLRAGPSRQQYERLEGGRPSIAERVGRFLGWGGGAGVVSSDIRLESFAGSSDTMSRVSGDNDEDEDVSDGSAWEVAASSAVATLPEDACLAAAPLSSETVFADSHPPPSATASSKLEWQTVVLGRFLAQLCAHVEASESPIVLKWCGALGEDAYTSCPVAASHGAPLEHVSVGGDDDPRDLQCMLVEPSSPGEEDGVFAMRLLPIPPHKLLRLPATTTSPAVDVVSSVGRFGLASFLGPGDILLFATNSRAAALQRASTGSAFDHIALICPPPTRQAFLQERNVSLWMMEVTGDGVGCYPLFGRLEAYLWTGLASRIVARRLMVGKERRRLSTEQCDLLRAFAQRTAGRPYALTVRKLLSGVVRPGPEAELVHAHTERVSYFCSELVAAAWMEAGVMLPDRPASWFWPRHFLVGGEAEACMREGYQLEAPVLVNADILEVHAAAGTVGSSGGSGSSGR